MGEEELHYLLSATLVPYSGLDDVLGNLDVGDILKDNLDHLVPPPGFSQLSSIASRDQDALHFY